MAGSTPRRKLLARSTAAVILAGFVWLGCTQDQSDITGLDSPLEVLRVQDLRPAINVQERYNDRLLSTPGVVGTAVGLTEDGRAAIKVFTMQAEIAGLPRELDGFPVLPEVTGMFIALSDPTARFDRPVPTGVSTGHPDVTAGTIGARVVDALGNVYALSNNHVYANQNLANLGDPVIQPGSADGGSVATDQIGVLDSFVAIEFASANSVPLNTVDAAIALSSTAELGNSTPADDGYGTPSSTTAAAYIGQPVQKYGRTTGLTHGQVSELNVTVDVCYQPIFIWCLKWARFTNQIAITPGGFSGGGDSGSLIVTDDGNNDPVGLLFAGGSDRTLANPIGPVLSAFGVTVDDAAAPPPTQLTDIAITDVAAPGSATQGDVVAVDVTVRNVGNQDVASSFAVTLRDDTDGIDIGTQTVAGLVAGASTMLTYSWDTNGASLGAHTLTARHDFADDNASNDSQSTSATIDPPTADMHVGDLDGSSSWIDTRWYALVTVRIHDDQHDPVANASVTGIWSKGTSGTSTCTTNSSGQCTLYKSNIRRRRKSVKLTVTSVTHATLTYNQGKNHDPDGDSDGTSITVKRP